MMRATSKMFRAMRASIKTVSTVTRKEFKQLSDGEMRRRCVHEWLSGFWLFENISPTGLLYIIFTKCYVKVYVSSLSCTGYLYRYTSFLLNSDDQKKETLPN